MTDTITQITQYRFRIMYRHFDGSVMVDQDDVRLEFAERQVATRNGHIAADNIEGDQRLLWIERQPAGEWERFTPERPDKPTFKHLDLGNNESKSRGVFPVEGGFLALTFSVSKTFKTRGGAVRWLARRGFDENGESL